MSAFRIDEVLTDGSVRAYHHQIGNLHDVCRAAFLLANELSLPRRPQHADVMWVKVYNADKLEIAISITPGIPMTGAVDLQSVSRA